MFYELMWFIVYLINTTMFCFNILYLFHRSSFFYIIPRCITNCIVTLCFWVLSDYYVYIHARVCRFKQWMNNTIRPIGNDRYLLVHYIDGQQIKFIINKNNNVPESAVDENYDECYIDRLLPFLRYNVEKCCPRTIGLKKPLLLSFESGKTITRFENN